VFYFLVLASLLIPAQRPARARGAEFSVPQGWAVEYSFPDMLLVQHSKGASLRVVRSRTSDDLRSFAFRAVDRLANPLGFARVGMPQHFNDANEEWFEYAIRGNRQAEHRRILYRASRASQNPASVIEMIYENSEDRFDVLLSEAQSIVTHFLSK
jgi:hypothetical protein